MKKIRKNKEEELLHLYNKKLMSSFIRRGLKLKAINKYNKVLYELKKKEKIQPSLVAYAALTRVAPLILQKNKGKGKGGILEFTTTTKKIKKSVAWVVKEIADKQKNRNPSTKKIVDVLCGALRNKGDAIAKKKAMYSLIKV